MVRVLVSFVTQTLSSYILKLKPKDIKHSFYRNADL